jgi:hypothetical protein
MLRVVFVLRRYGMMVSPHIPALTQCRILFSDSPIISNYALFFNGFIANSG